MRLRRSTALIGAGGGCGGYTSGARKRATNLTSTLHPSPSTLNHRWDVFLE
jgi:hypothetical protein